MDSDFLTNPSSPSSLPFVQDAFAQIDANNDGVISREAINSEFIRPS
jgi:hypothetical protein